MRLCRVSRNCPRRLGDEPLNANAHLVQAVALGRFGNNTGALEAARRRAKIAARTAHVHGWEAALGLVAIRCEHHSAAIAHSKAANYRAPGFRAAMRHLLFLYLLVGEREKAAQIHRGLLRVEPDCTVDRIVNEPHYPAVTLRRSGFLERSGANIATP